MLISPTTLTPEQVKHYEEKGWVRIPNVCSPEEVETLRSELDFTFENWAQEGSGWTGDFVAKILGKEFVGKTKGIVVHNLEMLCAGWGRFVQNQKLVGSMVDLLGPNVEYQSTSTHVKGPEAGMMFPMHQDSAFYNHETDKYIIAVLHLDKTTDENGVFRFVDGSHKLGHIPHVTTNADGSKATPHLSTDDWDINKTTPVYAEPGDVIAFNLYTIHGSLMNRSKYLRRLVVARYKDPTNWQTTGTTTVGPMVAGVRPPIAGYKACLHGQAFFQQTDETATFPGKVPARMVYTKKDGKLYPTPGNAARD